MAPGRRNASKRAWYTGATPSTGAALSIVSLATRARLYYGWVIVGALAFISMFMGGLMGLNYGLFIPLMARDLQIPHTYFGFALAGRSMGMALSGPPLGRLLDRVGPRRLLAVAGLIGGGLVAAQSLADSGWQLIAVTVALGLIGLQGGVNLYTSVPLAKWFLRLRGRATSLAFLGGPAGIFLFPPLSQWLIEAYGWRTAWVVLGVVCGLGISLIGVIFLRRQPQDLGQLPDGAEHPPAQPGQGRVQAGAHSDYPWTRQQALRSWTFWRLTMVFGVQMFGFSTMGIFRIPHFIDQGVRPEMAALALSAEAAASLVGGMVAGWAVDRFEHRYAAFGSFVLIELAFIMTIFANTTELTFLSTMLFGLGAASSGVNQNVLWPAYFGSANAGAVRGAALPITLSFSVVGAPLTGLVHDLAGSYLPAWWVACVALGAAGLLLVLTPKPALPKATSELAG